MTAELSDDDRGKTVVRGIERVSTVADVHGRTAYVDPNWTEVPEAVLEELDWGRTDDQHTIPASAVSGVQDDEIFLRDDLL